MSNTQQAQFSTKYQNAHRFITSHLRHQSEPMEKDNPWGKIDKALTQRYRIKFNECEKDHRERNSLNLNQQSHNSQTPLFQIKRKYLSFKVGPKDNNPQAHSEEKVSKQIPFSPRKPKSNLRSFSSFQFQRNESKEANRRYLYKIEDAKEIKNECSLFSSLTPYSNLSPKYKFIYVKRTRKQLIVDPELKVSIKIRDVKKNDIKDDQEKTQKLARLTQFYIPRKNRKTTANTPTKDLKSFRPWSGFQADELD